VTLPTRWCDDRIVARQPHREENADDEVARSHRARDRATMTLAPGFDELKLFQAELPGLSPQQRAAFAAGCAERVLPLVIDHMGEPGPCREAIDLAWRFAEGEVISATEAKAIEDTCEALIDEMHDINAVGYPMNAVRSATNALAIVTSSAWEAAVNAADAAMTAVENAHFEDSDEHVDEEATWQAQALDVVRSATVIKRTMFSHLPVDPQWLQEFRRQNPP